MSPKEIVLLFWEAMRSNNFYEASNWLSEDFECVWPQSSEIIVGPLLSEHGSLERFAESNPF